MGAIFKNQTKLDITLSILSDISDVVSALIKFRKPNGVQGEFVATIDTGEQSISYTVTSENDIDINGIWVFWAHLTYTNGDVIAGEASDQMVNLEGQ